MTNTAVQRVVYFQLWRWMFFFCGFVPIWWASFYIMRIVTIIVEARFFPFKQVLYYIIGVRVSLCTICTVSCFCQTPTWSGNNSLHMPTCSRPSCLL